MLKKIKIFINQEYSTYRMCLEHDKMFADIEGVGFEGTFRYTIGYIWSSIKHDVFSRVCKHRGHKFTLSHSHANGDSGYEDYECSRCGHYIHHTWY